MATTTPNYGWPVPTSTDFVKDGATAIEALGDAIDATVFGLPSGALTLLDTTTFSAQSSVSFDDVFSATYDNYLIHIANTGSTTAVDVLMRLRAAGVDNSSANYSRSSIFQSSTTVSGQLLTGQTSWIGVTSAVSTQRQFSQLTVFNPFATQYTALIGDLTSRSRC
jgi:hypothetical protein